MTNPPDPDDISIPSSVESDSVVADTFEIVPYSTFEVQEIFGMVHYHEVSITDPGRYVVVQIEEYND